MGGSTVVKRWPQHILTLHGGRPTCKVQVPNNQPNVGCGTSEQSSLKSGQL